jgi:hypothetical protein
MIATLRFNLEDEGDKCDFDMALKASDMFSMLEEIRNYRRHLRKYEDRDSIPTTEIVDKLDELLTED